MMDIGGWMMMSPGYCVVHLINKVILKAEERED